MEKRFTISPRPRFEKKAGMLLCKSFFLLTFVTSTAFAETTVAGPEKKINLYTEKFVAERDIPIKGTVKDENGLPCREHQ